MSAGAVATGVILLAVFSFLYITIGYMENKYQEKNNEWIQEDEYYSNDRRAAMDNAFDTWYALPVAVLILFIVFVILESIKDRTNEI